MTGISEAQKRLIEIEGRKLAPGAHPSPQRGLCVMEAVAYVAGEPHSDSPSCVSPVIGACLRRWNDDLDDEGRQRLKPYVLKVIGTRASKEIEEQRGWMCADWLVRHHTAAWLELAGLKEHAHALRALPELRDLATLNGARSKIAAAWAAAWDAAWDAAWAAARAAASKKLEPTKLSLQASAFELLDRMIALSA